MDNDIKNTQNTALDDKENGIHDMPVMSSLAPEDLESLKAMTEAGVHYGRKKSKTSPLMRNYIYATRNNIEVIDVAQTLEALKIATTELRVIIERGGSVLVVGTQPAFRDRVVQFAEKFSFPYVVERWLGGTLTNFKTIHARIAHFTKLKEDKAMGRLAKYSKKEQLMIQRELDRLEKFLGGLETMSHIPEAIFLIDVEEHGIALREAKRIKNMTIFGLINTDGKHVKDVYYAIPANTKGRTSLEWVLGYIEKGLEGARRPVVTEAPKK